MLTFKYINAQITFIKRETNILFQGSKTTQLQIILRKSASYQLFSLFLMGTICCFHHVFLKQSLTISKVNFVTPKTLLQLLMIDAFFTVNSTHVCPQQGGKLNYYYVYSCSFC